jgi:hypothetical protein
VACRVVVAIMEKTQSDVNPTLSSDSSARLLERFVFDVLFPVLSSSIPSSFSLFLFVASYK